MADRAIDAGGRVIRVAGSELLDPYLARAQTAATTAEVSAQEALASLAEIKRGSPTEFWNGMLDPDLPGPTDAFGGGLNIVSGDAVMTAAGLPRVIQIAAGSSQGLLHEPVRPIAPGDWIDWSVVADAASGADLAAFGARTLLYVVPKGGNLNNAQLIAPTLRETLGSTQAVYGGRAKVAFAAPLDEAMVDFLVLSVNWSTAASSIRLAGQAVHSSSAEPLQNVDWRDPDPLNLTRLLAGGAGAGPMVVLGDSLSVPIAGPLASLTGRVVENWGIGGQTSGQIVNRALGFTLRIAGTTIGGAARNVTHVNGIPIGAPAPDGTTSHQVLHGAGTTYSLKGWAGSAYGTLSSFTSDGGVTWTYSFLADAGQKLPVAFPKDTPFVPDFPEDATIVYVAGRNNFTEGRPDTGVAAIVADLRRLMLAYPKVLALGVPNGEVNAPNEYGPSGGLYLQIAAVNAGISAVGGKRFLDWPRMAKDLGLGMAGLTGDAQSETDAGHDVISHQLRGDDLHPNGPGALVAATLVAQRLAGMGW